MNTKNLSTLKIHKLTQVQYERELAAGRIDENALYLTPDDGYSRDDLDVILNNKADVGHTHSIANIDNLQETLDGHDIAIDELNEEVSIDYSQIAFDTGSKYEDSGIDFSVYQTKADGTLSTTAKTVSGAINELDAGIDNEASLRTAADTALDAKISQISNPNLLINSDFRNPINQRGQTSYLNLTTKSYGIDRWHATAGMQVVVNDNSITITNTDTKDLYFSQKFEDYLPTDTYTLSCKVLNLTGEAWIYNYNDFKLQTGINSKTLQNISDFNSFTYGLSAGSSIELEWAKLEQGSIATPFVPRHYGEELALCQRYYEANSISMHPQTGASSTQYYLVVNGGTYNVKKRTTPTLTFSSIMNNAGAALSISVAGVNHNTNGIADVRFNTAANSYYVFMNYVADAEIY